MSTPRFQIGRVYLLRCPGGRILFGEYRGEFAGIHAFGGMLLQFMPGLLADNDPVDLLADLSGMEKTETGTQWGNRVGIPDGWPF